MPIQILYGWRRCLGYSQSLKEQCHEIFELGFSWIRFPPTSEYPNRTVSNFFENSRRYSQLKVHHRCCWHRWQINKIFNQQIKKKNFEHLWVVESTCRCIFFFKFTFRCQQSDSVPIICHRCHWYQWCTLTCEYLREFLKKFEMTLMLLSEAWGKMIHEKKQKHKISWHCPFDSNCIPETRRRPGCAGLTTARTCTRRTSQRPSGSMWTRRSSIFKVE
jgi:hypothetical protein